jgi:hypothetical protein
MDDHYYLFADEGTTSCYTNVSSLHILVFHAVTQHSLVDFNTNDMDLDSSRTNSIG